MVVAFAAGPLRLPLPQDAYQDTPLCWWGRQRWLTHVAALYDTHYARLRAEGLVPAVARDTFLAVMGGMSEGADHTTGRDCRVPVGHTRRDGTRTGLVAATGKCRRTVQRARTLARTLHVITEVMPGRRRSLPERLESWRRGDKARGWCSVAVLHESPTLRAVPRTPAHLPEEGNVTPLVRSTGSLHNSPRSVVTQRPAGASPRRKTTKPRPGGRGRRAGSPALPLAEALQRHPRAPRWVHRHHPPAWARVLGPIAAAGWGAEDLLLALGRHGQTRTLLTDPRNPLGYLRALIATFDLDGPTPTALAQEQRHRAEQQRLAEQQQRRAENAARDARAAAPDSPTRLAALAQIRHIATTTRQRAATRRLDTTLAEAAHRETVARRQRCP